MVGNKGWLSDKYHLRISDLESKAKVRYHGYVSDNKLINLYESSFALLFPSHYEGFGLPVLEAMHFSLPIISNNIASVQEFHNESSIFVDFQL